MGFKELKEAFDKQIPSGLLTEPGPSVDSPEYTEFYFRYWQLRLLFEIAGNLDSLVVTNRNSEKHIEKMSAAYCELVQLQKDRAQK